MSNGVFNFNFLALVFSEILGGPKFTLGGPTQGRFYVGAGGAQAPQMLAKPPQIFWFQQQKYALLKSRLFLYSGEINTPIN